MNVHVGVEETQYAVDLLDRVFSGVARVTDELVVWSQYYRKQYHKIPTLGRVIELYTFLPGIFAQISALVEYVEKLVQSGESKYSMYASSAGKYSDQMLSLSSVGALIEFDTIMIVGLVVLLCYLAFLRLRKQQDRIPNPNPNPNAVNGMQGEH